MISNKMKEDAAKINSEIKIIATKMPLLFHKYNYLNEDAKLVLKRRNDQLNAIQGLNDLSNEIDAFSSLLNSCEKDFKDVCNHLEELGMGNMLGDAAADDSDEGSGNSFDDSRERKGDPFINKNISRENSFVPDTPAINNRKKLNFVKN